MILTSKTKVKKILKSKDPAQVLLNWANSDPKPPRGFNKWKTKEMAIFLSLTQVIYYNMQAISVFRKSLCDLIGEARQGDDSALFDAILVDRSAMTSITGSKRIARAMLENDGEFFDHLTKAIKGTRPKRPHEKFNDLRFMVELLDQSIGIKNTSHKKIYNLLVEDLELYPETGKDAMKGFEKFIERQLKIKPT